MLLLYPATLAFSLSNFLLFYVLTTRDVSTYVGITAFDAGLRVAHFVTYATLSRSRLQLPVGAFLPAPEALSATDMVLYAAPAAVATWRSSVVVRECVSDFAQTMKVVVSRTVDAVQQQWDYLDVLVHTRPAVMLASERTYYHYFDETQWPYNRSSILAPISIHMLYDYPTLPLILTPPLLSTGSSDICPLPVLGVCAIDGYFPDPVVTVALAALPGLELHRLNIEPLETPKPPQSTVHEPFADLEGVAVGFYSPIQPTIIHVRSCLIGLLVVCIYIYCCYTCIRLTLRLIIRLARFMCYGVCALCTSVRGLTIRPGIVSRSIETIEVASEDICGAVPAMDVANSPTDRNRGSGLPTSEPPPISISNSSIGADEDDPPRLSYFDKGKWPEVDINEARRELARTGAPMMAMNPTRARTSTAPPLPEAVLVLDIPDGHPAELPKVDPSPRLDDVARALLSSCDEFGCVVDEGWTDESDGRSLSRSGAPSPDLAHRSPVVSDAESDAAHVLPSFGSAQSAGEVGGKAGDVKKQVRWRDEKGGGLERGRAEVTGQLERAAHAARAKVRPVSIPRRAGRG